MVTYKITLNSKDQFIYSFYPDPDVFAKILKPYTEQSSKEASHWNEIVRNLLVLLHW